MTREEAIEHINNLRDIGSDEAIDMAIEALQERHGKWEKVDEYANRAKKFRCTSCDSLVETGHYTKWLDYKYCPYCKAKMDKEQQHD